MFVTMDPNMHRQFLFGSQTDSKKKKKDQSN